MVWSTQSVATASKAEEQIRELNEIIENLSVDKVCIDIHVEYAPPAPFASVTLTINAGGLL